MQLSLLAAWDRPALLLSDLSISSDGYSIHVQTRWSLGNFGRSRTSIWFALDSERFSREGKLFDEFQQAFKPPTFKNNKGVFPNQFQPVPRLL